MPELSFVLPHWMYWTGLLLFPLVTMLLFRRNKSAESERALSLPMAYALLVSGGMVGIHRLYLKSTWALAFVTLFLAILFINVEVREARNALSGANNQIMLAEYRVERAQKNLERGRANAEQKLEQAQESLEQAKGVQLEAEANQQNWLQFSQALGLGIILLLLIDVVRLPGLVRDRNAKETVEPDEGFQCPAVAPAYSLEDEPFAFNRAIGRLNGWVGEFVAYWSLIAVVTYYYEVMARYTFNSPTNWAHESMFLMFGMQYLLAGGFVLREGSHVRVDVIYLQFSKRGKAIVDLATSIFFFIFTITLMFTGWTFFMDSYNVGEVSFTEWGIQYWPIKFALPLGALLLLLQGVALLLKDIAIVINPDTADIPSRVPPEI